MTLEKEFECYAAIREIEEILEELQSLMAVDYLKAINGVSGAINTLKTLADVAFKSRNVDLQMGLLDLREQIVELREILVLAKEENFELKQKIAELEKQAEQKLIIRDGVYYSPDGDGPFCTGCYDAKKQKVRLSQLPAFARDMGRYQCPVCHAPFT